MILGALALLLIPSAGPAAASVPEPKYQFETLLVPQEGHQAGPAQGRPEAWIRGGLFTEGAARLDRAVAIGADYPVIGTEVLFAVARGDRAIACTLDRMVKRSERPHFCLADTDGDGKRDAWFTFGDEIVMFEYVRKVPLKRMKQLSAPVTLTPVDAADLSAVRPQVGFEIVPLDGRLELCRTYKGKNDGYCTHAGPSLDKSGRWRTVALRGAEFRYRKVDKTYEVQTLRPFVTQRF